MRILGLLLTTLLVVPGVTRGAEHPACSDPGFAYQQQSVAQLRKIAATCNSDAVARLYYERASHAALLEEGEALAGLIPLGHRGGNVDLESYRLYIALIEVMAPVWFEDRDDQIAFLNAEYTWRTELAELRLKGYEPIAQRLESRRRKP